MADIHEKLVAFHEKPTLKLTPYDKYVQSLIELTKPKAEDSEEMSALEIDEALQPLAELIDQQTSSEFIALPAEDGQTPVFELHLSNTLSLSAFHKLGNKLCGFKEDNAPLQRIEMTNFDNRPCSKGFNQGYAF